MALANIWWKIRNNMLREQDKSGWEEDTLILNCLLPHVKAVLELRCTCNFLTLALGWVEPLHAQLFARHPCLSLMDTLVEVHNEETHFWDAGLLQVSSVLATRSSVAHPAAPVPLSSPLIAQSTTRGESTCLHCDQCGHDGHVETFCYNKKKVSDDPLCQSNYKT
jgi:hypothetical protein